MKRNTLYLGKLFLVLAIVSIVLILGGCSTSYSTVPPAAPTDCRLTGPAALQPHQLNSRSILPLKRVLVIIW